MPSGFTPPSERSRSNRGDSHSDPDLGSRPLVPAAATIMVQRPGTSSSSRAVARTFTSQRSSNNDANASTSSSDGPRRPPQELSATQATFLAGAAVSHAHHASGVALQAAQAAQDSQQRERQVVEQASLFGNALRHEARHVADAARQAVSQAQHSEQAARAQAQSAVQTLHQAASAAVLQAQQSEQALRAEAESAVSTIQQQANMRIAALEREVAQGREALDRLTDVLAEAQQRRFQAEDLNRTLGAQMQELQRQFQLLREGQEALPPPTLEPAQTEPPVASQEQTPHLSFPSMVFEPDSSLNATVLSPIAQTPKSSPPTPVPKASPCAPAQGAATGAPATTPPVPASSSEQNELGKQVEDLKFLVVGLMKDVHRLNTSATATVSAPAPAEGAAGGAPQQFAQQGEAASSAQPQATAATGAVPTLVLPLKPRQQTPQGDDPDSSNSSSSSSSSGTPAQSRPACRMCGSKAHDEEDCPFLTINRPPGGGGDGGGSPDGDPEGNPSAATARSGAAASSKSKTPAELEEEVIRIKSLADLTFPAPPENAAQARGFVNQVLMAIGKVQRSPGNEVYLWAQDCMKLDDKALASDLRFPRLDREIAAKLIKVCRSGRFGLLFQQMVESERMSTGGMPNGRCMLRAIFRHFQLEKDRIGMLAERNLLNIRLGGGSIAELIAFRDKYLYVMTTIPLDDQPRETTLFNHLIDELDKCPTLKAKVEKAREAGLSSHRRTTEWLWKRVDIAIELHQQKINRQEFDRTLQAKPEVLTSTTTQKPNVPANPAKPDAQPKGDKPTKEKKEKKRKKKKKKDKDGEDEVPATPAPNTPRTPRTPKGKGQKGKGKGKGGSQGDTTPRSQQAQSAKNMSAEEKARTPCMFYAYGACRSDNCAFLHDDANKYKGPKPKSLAKAKPKAKAKANAAIAPIISAMPLQTLSSPGKVAWLWDTAAGRHLIGRQALSARALACIRPTDSPVGFATGGGAREGSHTLAFEGSKILPADEQVYVLKECPPAFSVGKAVVDDGHMFVWDPREDRPFLVPKKELHRCKLRIPRGARINASRVVEYVPQFDEELHPSVHSASPALSPVTASAVPAYEEGSVLYPPGCDDIEYVPDFPDADDELEPASVEALADEPTEPGDSDEEAAIVEAYSVAERVRRQLFHKGAVGEAAAEGEAEPDVPMLKPSDDIGAVVQPDGKIKLVPLARGAAEGAPPKDSKPDKPPPSKEEALRAEAVSAEHLRTHFPKNPFCKVCTLAKTTSMRVSHKPDGKRDDMVDAPEAPFQQLATDDVILAKGDDHRGLGLGGVKSHHVIRDVFSGARVAYPMSRRGAQQHARNFRHFMGLKASSITPVCLIKMDEAGELKVAAEEVGFVPETSLPNRWPHNAVLERDVREEKECCRAIHLQSGLPYDFHTHSLPYACLSLSFDRTAPGSDKTQWEALTKEAFQGKRGCFGQLVWYRQKGSKRTLDPNMAPGLFLGWRIDPGMRYRNVVRVLDYQEFRNKRNSNIIDVPEPELYIEDGPPVFPVANATHKSLVDGSVLEGAAARGALPDIPLRDFPFPPEDLGLPPLRDPKARGVYITVERVIKFGETPGCKACRGGAPKHTDACRARFAELVRVEKEEAAAKKAVPEPVSEPVPEPMTEELEGGAAEASGAPVIPAGVANPPCCATHTQLAETSKGGEHTPVFGLTAPSVPRFGTFKVRNRRARRANKASKLTTVFEYACSPNSMLGRVDKELSVPHVRLSKEELDVQNPIVATQLHEQLRSCKQAHLMVSLPCTSGCPWRRVNLKERGAPYRKELARKIVEARKLFNQFAEHAYTALSCGHHVTFEWPRYSDSWKRPEVKRFFNDSRFKVVDFDGCRLGVCNDKGEPVKKPWRIMTTSDEVVKSFAGLTCQHQAHEHGEARGRSLEGTGFYTQPMCELLARSFNPRVATQLVPALPVVPVVLQTEHREKEQQLKHESPLAGLDQLATVIESDETAKTLVEEIADLHGLFCDMNGLPKETPGPEVNALVPKLLSRAEMLASPEALAAIRSEADGLRSVPVWDEQRPREFKDVQSEARASGTKVHFGKLMTIASIKFYELAKHLQKVKGRIVYRGDCAKDEEGAAAVYRELGANPTSVQGLNACMAYGALPGNATSAADAIKAYVQALLKSKFQTWIELPPELRPKWWRDKFVRPVVLLLRALYGHPEAGGLWEKHLKQVLRQLGGEEVPEYPGNFWFPETKLLLSTYVDDLTLSGPQEEHQRFWDRLTALVDVEPPEPVFRVLGRNHYVIDSPAESSENAALGALKDAVVFDMIDYAQQAVDLYTSITGSKLKPANTPFCPEGSLIPADDEASGELAPNACKILMKALWLGRLARPDIVKPIGDMASCVQKWSRNNDKQLHRLICYINTTKTYRLVGQVGDDPRELRLALYVDADFAGEKSDAKSNSGGYLVLKGPNTFFPLAWVSKRQTSVSRSTTESEIVSLAHSLFQEGLPALSLWERLLGRTSVQLVIHEDNQATILVAKKGYSPKLRHIARTHKVNLGSISEQLEEGTGVEIEYVDTAEQAADIFTKALVPQKWDRAIKLLGIRQKLPAVLTDKRNLTVKAGSGPKTSNPTP